jgi:hypothetical protein
MVQDHCAVLLATLRGRIDEMNIRARESGLKDQKFKCRLGVCGPSYVFECGVTGLFWSGLLNFLPTSTYDVGNHNHMNLKQIEQLVENWATVETTIYDKIEKAIAKESPKDCCGKNKETSDKICKSILETLEQQIEMI